MKDVESIKYCEYCRLDTKHINGICQLCIAKIEMQSGVDPFDEEESSSLRINREIDKN